MFSITPCRKYRKLRLRAEDVAVSARQERFLEIHALFCVDCREYDRQVFESREALRDAPVQTYLDPNFTARVVRALSLDRLGAELRLWKPAMLGAISACVAVGAMVQVSTTTPDVMPATPVGSAEVVPDVDAPIFTPPRVDDVTTGA